VTSLAHTFQNIRPVVGRATVPGRAHLVGIAGSGMRSLADVLLGLGWKLSGSDPAAADLTHLAATGVRLAAHHDADNLPPTADMVVHSDAVPADNPELCRAAERGIERLSYFEMLGRMMTARRGLAVAGTHGKSTTTAMASDILVGAGLDPTVVLGATGLGQASGGRAGRGKHMLVEACEYRANFLHLRPQRAVILGIEPDHFDCYDSPAALERAFARLARSIPDDGLLIARHDCQTTRRVAAEAGCRTETFGLDEHGDWSAVGLRCRLGRYDFQIRHRGRPFCRVRLKVPGRHNVLNALAAAALGWSCGVGPDRIGRALGRFAGLHRRLESLGCWRGVPLLDDYAHHPTEVSATLDTMREMYPEGRICCVFQPHQVCRTERLLDELAASLHNADMVVVADIFRAREPGPRPGEVAAADLARLVGLGGSEVADVHDTESIVQLLETCLLPGDVLVTMGAGDIRKLYHGIDERI